MTDTTIAYAVIAAGGLVATWWHNIALFREGGSVSDFVTDGYANHAAGSLVNDLWFLGAAALVFMIVDSRRVGVRHVWVYLVLSFGVAVSVAFPLYLIARNRALRPAAETPR